jgi:hypothetical protein
MVDPVASGGVAKGARIAPKRRQDGGASVRLRREPGSFPSLPWPRGATSAGGERARVAPRRASLAVAGGPVRRLVRSYGYALEHELEVEAPEGGGSVTEVAVVRADLAD